MDKVAGIQHQVQRGMEHIRTCYVWSSIRPVHLETKLPVVTRVAVLVSISLTEVFPSGDIHNLYAPTPNHTLPGLPEDEMLTPRSSVHNRDLN